MSAPPLTLDQKNRLCMVINNLPGAVMGRDPKAQETKSRLAELQTWYPDIQGAYKAQEKDLVDSVINGDLYFQELLGKLYLSGHILEKHDNFIAAKWFATVGLQGSVHGIQQLAWLVKEAEEFAHVSCLSATLQTLVDELW